MKKMTDEQFFRELEEAKKDPEFIKAVDEIIKSTMSS